MAYVLTLAALVVIALVVLAALLFSLAYLAVVFFGAPFVPTGKKFVAHMMEHAQVGAGDTLLDLGSGDGRIVIAAAKRGAHATGVELNPFLVLYARWRIWRRGLGGRAHIIWGSMFDMSFAQYSVISVFGITRIMPRIAAKCMDELKPGSRIVSYVFSIPSWTPEVYKDGVRVYRISNRDTGS